MYELYEQGLKNKVELHLITAAEARKIDPMVRGHGREFIWSPTTSVVDSKGITEKFAEELEGKGRIEIRRGY
jgi:L-2-hydroxyglutarate oxidase LhgO